MSELTKEWLLKTIAELEEERDALPGAVNEDAANALATMKLALASLEAEPVAWDYESASYITCEGPQKFKHIIEREAPPEWAIDEDRARNIVPLYTAPPAPVSVPEMKPVDLDEGFDEWYSEGESGADSVAPEWFSEAMKPVFLGTWRACRAAMLQGAENAESPTTMQTAPSLDSSQIIAESPSGNSPVIPDCWVACSERMPNIGVPVITCCGDVVQYAAYAWDGKEWQDCYEEYDKLPANTFTHWHPRPAAPQQEVK